MASSRKIVWSLQVTMFVCLLFCSVVENVKEKRDKKDLPESEKWKKKDVRDYTDADLERLYEQWEDADDEKLEDDELPEWKRPQPKIDLSKVDPNDPEGMLKMTKKGKTLMMFATVSGNPTKKDTEQITQLWQSSLFNANKEVQRYVVGENRVLFMLKDGALAWEVKDFLVSQDRCEVVTIEGKDYPGKASKQGKQEDNKTKKKKSKSGSKKSSSGKKSGTASKKSKKDAAGKKTTKQDTRENETKRKKKEEL